MHSSRGYKKEDQDEIANKMPKRLGELPVSYENILDIVENPDKYLQAELIKHSEYEAAVFAYNALQELFKKHPEIEKALLKLKGAVNSVGCHAGGVVITSKPLCDHIPVVDTHGKSVMHISQLDMDAIHFFKALKLDVLGLKSMSQIGLCLEYANIDFSFMDREDCDDEKVYSFLAKGNTTNIFQMSNPKPTNMIKENKITHLEQLVDINALNRPGCLAVDSVSKKSIYDSYLHAFLTGEVPSYHVDIDHIMKATHGEILFQEQIMQIGMILAGYSLGMADLRLRKPIAKKNKKVIPEVRNEFIYGKKSLYDEEGNVCGISEEDSPNCEGCIKRGYKETLAIKVFNVIERFASYSFNLSHSRAYAVTAYKTAYLSCYYPAEWAAACLTLDSDDGNAKEKMISTLNYCKKMKIKLKPPSINYSDEKFNVYTNEKGEKSILFSFLGIKGIGGAPLGFIKELREEKKFTGIDDFLNRVYVDNEKYKTMEKYKNKSGGFNNPITKSHIVPLILVGAFDEFNENRHEVYNQYVDFRINVQKTKDMEYKDATKLRMRERLEYEMEYLNFYVSRHPLDGNSFPFYDFSTVKDKDEVYFTGIFKKIEQKRDKNNKIFYNISYELRDSTIVKTLVYKDSLTKFGYKVSLFTSDRAKDGKEIFRIKGEWGERFSNVSKLKIMERVISKIEKEDESKLTEIKHSEGFSSLEELEIAEDFMNFEL